MCISFYLLEAKYNLRERSDKGHAPPNSPSPQIPETDWPAKEPFLALASPRLGLRKEFIFRAQLLGFVSPVLSCQELIPCKG